MTTQRDTYAGLPGGAMGVVGMFDGVHRGHRYLLDELLRESRRRGLSPLVVTFANHPLEEVAPERAPKLLMSTDEKVALLRAAGAERVVCLPFDASLRATSAADFIGELHSRYGVEALLMGYNNRFGHDAPRDFEAYRALGGAQGVDIIAASEYSGGGVTPSSTAIRRALEQGNPAEAEALLGRPYSLTGRVEHGKELGRRLGFPTANVAVDGRLQLPAPGVYAARATAGGVTLPAMVNIGRRPTVDGPEAALSVEAHIIGLPEGTDLYGRELRLEFCERLRAERRFATTDELAAQLRRDKAATIERIKG